MHLNEIETLVDRLRQSQNESVTLLRTMKEDDSKLKPLKAQVKEMDKFLICAMKFKLFMELNQ
jgi:hypothetical protein